MKTIVFIYKIKNDTQKYYGKYITHITHYISDDDGLDMKIQPKLLHYLNLYRTQIKIPELQSTDVIVGIVSFYEDSYINYSSRSEISCFDFYFISFNNRDKDTIEECWIGDWWSCKSKNNIIESISL